MRGIPMTVKRQPEFEHDRVGQMLLIPIVVLLTIGALIVSEAKQDAWLIAAVGLAMFAVLWWIAASGPRRS
jgi:hypothetical protein